MKKVLIILTLFAGLAACENFGNDFPDYDYTTGYFPYQYPVRTLVLGDDIYDNTNDNNHKFLISAAMGGVYENERERVFDIEPAPELCSNVKFGSTNEAIRLMPQNYYTLSSSSQLTIPAGKVNGSIEVQLTDAFFDDPLAIKLGYVIPLRLVGSNDVDTILQGKASVANPDPRVAGDWATVPKNFTMFAVKYINPYHGTYFRRGSNVVKNSSGSIVENNIYHAQYVVQNGTWSLLTTGKEQVSVNSTLNSMSLKGSLMIDLLFGSGGNCTIFRQGSTPVIGTGKFIKDGDEWGDKKRNAIILSYHYSVDHVPIPAEPIKTIIDNNNASITYEGQWVHDKEAASYGGNRSYANKTTSYFTFNFTGDGIEIYCKTGSAYGTFDVFIDDVLVGSKVSTVTSTTLYQQKVFEKYGLYYGPHQLKVTIKETKNTIFDYLVYTVPDPNAPPVLPAGTYTIETKDTLVVRDRAVTLELYSPVVSK